VIRMKPKPRVFRNAFGLSPLEFRESRLHS